ncbi:hypothetical protein Tco_0706899 [Tanacetum coccineum]|uniref:Uncharacterized protein n=1 Tax=Tanacetum coccineum TaxID=301880 RepID=A0ABQ4YAU6_9ASTR
MSSTMNSYAPFALEGVSEQGLPVIFSPAFVKNVNCTLAVPSVPFCSVEALLHWLHDAYFQALFSLTLVIIASYVNRIPCKGDVQLLINAAVILKFSDVFFQTLKLVEFCCSSMSKVCLFLVFLALGLYTDIWTLEEADLSYTFV